MEKTHCSNCGCHKDNQRFVHCYGDRHINKLTKEESIEMFPRDCYIDMRTKKLRCSKTMELLTTIEELKTKI